MIKTNNPFGEKEKRWLLALILFTIFFTTLPYLVAYHMQRGEWQFTGALIGVEDGNSYIAKMLSGWSGDWFFFTPYTAYPQQGLIAFLPYILLGKLASTSDTHTQLVLIFHFLRWVSIAVYIFGTYKFIALFISKLQLRRFAIVLATFGGGLGWLSIIGLSFLWGGYAPLEFYSNETFGFLSLFSLPHLAISRGLLFLGLVYFIAPKDKKIDKYIPGFLWLIMGFFQPLTVATGWVIVSAFTVTQIIISVLRNKSFNWIINKDLIFSTIRILTISSPIIIYYSASIVWNPFYRDWSNQNILTSPPPIDYILAYGLVLPWVILGFINFIKKKEFDNPHLILWVWIISFPFLAYAPLSIQRRLPDGIWVVIVIITIWKNELLQEPIKRIGYYFVPLLFLSTLCLYSSAFLSVNSPNIPVFRPTSEIKAFLFLLENASKKTVVLASYQTSNALPAWAPMQVVTGHGPESIHLKEVQSQVNCFYKENCIHTQREAFIKTFSVQYVFWGPYEREIGGWNPNNWNKLIKVFDENGYSIFKVVDEAFLVK